MSEEIPYKVWKYEGHSDDVRAVAVDADGYVYSGSSDNTVHKITPDGDEEWVYTGHSNTVRAVAVDSDGYVYSGSRDDELHKIKGDEYTRGNRTSPVLYLGDKGDLKTLVFQWDYDLNDERNIVKITYKITDHDDYPPTHPYYEEVEIGETIELPEDLSDKYLWVRQYLRQHHDAEEKPKLHSLTENFFD